MAKILGKAGRYASDEAARLKTRSLMIAFVMIGILGAVEGMTLSRFWSELNLPLWLNEVVQLGGIVAMGLLILWGIWKLDKLKVSGNRWKRGAEGESVVGNILAELPDDFYVINDVNTPMGNLDHVVVGPAGVFVLDAKNWRGLVQADGSGELLLNGKPIGKNCIRNYTTRFMEVKNNLCSESLGINPYFQGVYVFTSAYVDARWGTTRMVHCMSEDRLRNYIVEKRGDKRLKPSEVKTVAEAFERMARKEKGFTEQATRVAQPDAVLVGVTQPA